MEAMGVGLAGLLMLLMFPVIFLIGIAALAFWIWMLVDCATKEPSEGNDKLIWILIIVLAGGLGALVYLLARRPQRIQQYGR